MDEGPLGSLLELIVDHRGKTPKKLGGDFSSAGVPVASAVNVKDGRLTLGDPPRYVTEEMARKWMPVPLRKGDVLLTSEAPLGEVARVPSNDPLVLGQRLFGLRGKQGALDSGYLYYLLQWSQIRGRLEARSTGTTVHGIRQSELVKIKVPTPPIAKQRAIAQVLGELDNKIEANRGLIDTSARLLEASWHERFGLPNGSGLTGREARIGDLVPVLGGSTPSTREPRFWSGGTYAWATPRDLSRLSAPPLLRTERTITDAGLSQISSGLLPAGTVLLSSRAPIGYLAIAETPVAVNQGFIALVPTGDMPSLYLWQWARSSMDAILMRANGTTFLEVSKAAFRPLSIRLPEPVGLANWMTMAHPLYRRLVTAVMEAESLGRLRDAMLPALMSGQVRVTERRGLGTAV